MINHAGFYTPSQTEIINCPLEQNIFLEGPAGSGKTSTGIGRLEFLLRQGIPGNQILVLVPQRTLAFPYSENLNNPEREPGAPPLVNTIGSLARQMIELFWPLVSKQAGFLHPEKIPVFLNIETAQYHLARVISPYLNQGFFDGVAIDRNRLYGQVLDNLNKSAFIGFPHTEIGSRLKDAWLGRESQHRIYADTQACATYFRQYCLNHNLLDFSLQLEIFVNFLWPFDLVRDHLIEKYPHIIFDNIEEDTPIAHDILLDWLPECSSGLVIYDTEAGYRRFLGADPISALRLKNVCDRQFTLEDSFVTNSIINDLSYHLGLAINQEKLKPQGLAAHQLTEIMVFQYHRYYPEMLDWVSEEIRILVEDQGIPPGEIVVLAPYLSDSLRFSLLNRLTRLDIPAQSHRPSRSLREEPASQCLLTLGALAHPSWNIDPTTFDVAASLVQAIDGLDLIRAQLLTEVLYRIVDGIPVLLPFENVKSSMQERITYTLGERYDILRLWLEDYHRQPPEFFDHFISRLFGEILSQPGFRFHNDFDAGKVTANLIESARGFRWILSDIISDDDFSIGKEFFQMVKNGMLASQYVRSWEFQSLDAVLLAPAYTFLMANRPVSYQFWLNAGSPGWWERLFQPLTHPYVVSRNWEPGRQWTDMDENAANQENMFKLVVGLLRRCKKRIYLGLSELDENGFEARGPLLTAIQKVLRSSSQF